MLGHSFQINEDDTSVPFDPSFSSLRFPEQTLVWILYLNTLLSARGGATGVTEEFDSEVDVFDHVSEDIRVSGGSVIRYGSGTT